MYIEIEGAVRFCIADRDEFLNFPEENFGCANPTFRFAMMCEDLCFEN